MCGTCGCATTVIDGRPESHGGHEAHRRGTGPRRVAVERDLLAHNDAHAQANRAELTARGVLAVNLLSGPGAGKTSLLVATARAVGETGRFPMAVIEGDQQTSRDADRLRAAGVAAVQINTGKGCHLEAAGTGAAMAGLPLPPGGVLFIENVGNLVCPAAFDLGEAARVVLFSTTEGEDKPLKYPDVFAVAQLVLITKSDLLAHLDVDVEAMHANVRAVNPDAEVLHVAVPSGEGIPDWLAWLDRRRAMDGGW